MIMSFSPLKKAIKTVKKKKLVIYLSPQGKKITYKKLKKLSKKKNYYINLWKISRN